MRQMRFTVVELGIPLFPFFLGSCLGFVDLEHGGHHNTGILDQRMILLFFFLSSFYGVDDLFHNLEFFAG